MIDCLRALAVIATDTPNIAALHSITVGQALDEIFAEYPSLDEVSLRRGYRDYIVALVLAYELPNAHDSIHNHISLTEIYNCVAQLKNDHSQKSSFSLTRLYEKTGYPEFLSAAKKFQNAFG